MSTERSSLGVGIIGAGGMGRIHAEGWRKIPDVRIAGICDVDLDRARNLAKILEVEDAVTVSDYRQLVAMDEVEVVSVCVPNRVHTPAVVAALEAGCHVLCEKPLAVTTSEIKEMARAAEKNSCKLMTAQHMRFREDTVVVKRFIDAGHLGNVFYAKVTALRRNLLPAPPGFIDSSLSGGGPCMDMGVHVVDTAMYLMGFPTPLRVSGAVWTNFAKGYEIPAAGPEGSMWDEWDRERFDVEDFAVASVFFEGGAVLVLETSWLSHLDSPSRLGCELFGTKAWLRWPDAKFSFARDRIIHTGELCPPRSAAGRSPYDEEIAAFHRCIVEDTTSPVPPQESIKVVAVLEAVYRSHEEGREVEIPPESITC